MKETLKISDRFTVIKKLGQGTFSKSNAATHRWLAILSHASRVFWINQSDKIGTHSSLPICLGYIYEAADKILKKNVALKIEKKDKNKSILIFEYNVLQTLQGKYRYNQSESEPAWLQVRC
jgi:serine/threonine protein kinase